MQVGKKEAQPRASRTPQRRKLRIVLWVLLGLLIVTSLLWVGWLYQVARTNLDAADRRLDETQASQAEVAAYLAKRWEVVPITLPGAQSIDAIFEDYTLPNSLWVVVNKSRPISTSYAPSSLEIPAVATRTDKSKEEQSVDGRLLTPLKDLFAAAAAEGHQLMIGSAYRSAALQQTYFNSYAAVSGVEAANQYSAHPGQSEHQLGLAVDISSLSQQCYLDECFTSTPDGEWLAKNAYRFGFILRYPLGKESITGYNFEPWHYRYVGAALATALHESGLTLDEAWPYLESALQTLRSNHAFFSNATEAVPADQ